MFPGWQQWGQAPAVDPNMQYMQNMTAYQQQMYYSQMYYQPWGVQQAQTGQTAIPAVQPPGGVIMPDQAQPQSQPQPPLPTVQPPTEPPPPQEEKPPLPPGPAAEPAKGTVPTIDPAPPVEPPVPQEEKPPLPPDPPPPDGEEPPTQPPKPQEEELKPKSEAEQEKLSALQAQAQQWQQQQQEHQQQWQQYHQNLQQYYQQQQEQQQQQSSPTQWGQNQQQNWGQQQQGQGDKSVELDGVLKEEEEFNKQYADWMKQYEEWKEQNKNHPNKEQFAQYEAQWKQYETQMETKRTEIAERKQAAQNQPNSNQQQQEEVKVDQAQGPVDFGGPSWPQGGPPGSNFRGRGPNNFQGGPRFPGPRGPGPRWPAGPGPSPRFGGPPQRFGGPRHRFDGPRHRFDGPRPRFDGPPNRFGGPYQGGYEGYGGPNEEGHEDGEQYSEEYGNMHGQNSQGLDNKTDGPEGEGFNSQGGNRGFRGAQGPFRGPNQGMPNSFAAPNQGAGEGDGFGVENVEEGGEMGNGSTGGSRGAQDPGDVSESVPGTETEQRMDGSNEDMSGGHPRFQHPGMRPRFDGPNQGPVGPRFGGPRFEGHRGRFPPPSGQTDGPRQRFDGPGGQVEGPRPLFGGPSAESAGPKFGGQNEGPRPRFTGPSGEAGGGPRFGGPGGSGPRFGGPGGQNEGPRPRFGGPSAESAGPKFGGQNEGPRPRFAGPSGEAGGGPRFGGPGGSGPRFGGPGGQTEGPRPRFGGPSGEAGGGPRFGGPGGQNEGPRPRFGGPSGEAGGGPRFGGPGGSGPRFGGPGGQNEGPRPRFGGPSGDIRGPRPRFGGPGSENSGPRPRFGVSSQGPRFGQRGSADGSVRFPGPEDQAEGPSSKLLDALQKEAMGENADMDTTTQNSESGVSLLKPRYGGPRPGRFEGPRGPHPQGFEPRGPHGPRGPRFEGPRSLGPCGPSPPGPRGPGPRGPGPRGPGPRGPGPRGPGPRGPGPRGPGPRGPIPLMGLRFAEKKSGEENREETEKVPEGMNSDTGNTKPPDSGEAADAEGGEDAADPESSAAKALSAWQHDIIKAAAEELKMLRQQQAKLDQLAQMEAAVKAAEEQHSAGPSRLVPYEDPEDESTIQGRRPGPSDPYEGVEEFPPLRGRGFDLERRGEPIRDERPPRDPYLDYDDHWRELERRGPPPDDRHGPPPDDRRLPPIEERLRTPLDDRRGLSPMDDVRGLPPPLEDRFRFEDRLRDRDPYARDMYARDFPRDPYGSDPYYDYRPPPPPLRDPYTRDPYSYSYAPPPPAYFDRGFDRFPPPRPVSVSPPPSAVPSTVIDYGHGQKEGSIDPQPREGGSPPDGPLKSILDEDLRARDSDLRDYGDRDLRREERDRMPWDIDRERGRDRDRDFDRLHDVDRDRLRDYDRDRLRDFDRDRFRNLDRERDRFRDRDRDRDRDRRDRERSRSRERDRDMRDRERDRDRDRERERDRDRERDHDTGSLDPDSRKGQQDRDRLSQGAPPSRSGGYGAGSSGDPFFNRPPGPSVGMPPGPPPGPPPSSIHPGPPPGAPPHNLHILPENLPKIESVPVEQLLSFPGRKTRPERIVIIVRGLPGSGKTYVSKLLKDKEMTNGGSAPRMLCLDDYFMTEIEKTETDPESGKKITKMVLEYEYEKGMEERYRQSLLKSFKKQIDNCYFSFIIIDMINDKVKHFEEFWSYAKSKGFQVYLADVQADVALCIKRNVHNRTAEEIQQLHMGWEPTPRHFLRLDIRTLLQEAAIEEVEMEDSTDEPPSGEMKQELEEAPEEEEEPGYKKSRWEISATEDKLDQLDGLNLKKRKRDSSPQRMQDYLQLPEDYMTRTAEPGKKRVRWADIEERADQMRRREMGFIIGQTDWAKITDDSYAHRALNQTKYI